VCSPTTTIYFAHDGMVLERQRNTIHNAMLGRRIPRPPSTNFDEDGSPRPTKKLKTYDSIDEDLDSRDGSENDAFTRVHSPSKKPIQQEIADSEDEDNLSDDVNEQRNHYTELEIALVPVKTDREAIEEYEALKASGEAPEDLKDRLHQKSWTKGKSSIYVDAFNLALETVLEDEGHLFDEKEMEVFERWRDLDYEAQYL